VNVYVIVNVDVNVDVYVNMHVGDDVVMYRNAYVDAGVYMCMCM